MAVFDPVDGKIVLRVVYDGPAFAGKTTNLRSLCGFFTTLRRSEMFSSENAAGRTLHLDWLQLEGGVVAGHAMRCHLITVPGQAVLSHRRRHLLRMADSVVFVADSDPTRMQENLLMMGELRTFLREERDVPIVLQANKQDAPSALEARELLERFGLPAETPISPANANAGNGVRETLILAVRAASSAVHKTILEAGLDTLEQMHLSGQDLERELANLEIGQNNVERVFKRYGIRSSAPPPPTSQRSAPPAEEHKSKEAPPEEPARVETASSAPAARVEEGSHEEGGGGEAPPVDGWAAPLPEPNRIPSGLIWPSSTGREILRRIPLDEAVARHDLIGRRGLEDGSGRSDVVIYEAGIWCLKTSLRRRFTNFEDARAALLNLARKKMLLGGLMIRNTVLVVNQDSAGAYWLWTVSPWLATLRAWMGHAASTDNVPFLAEGLCNFADAVVEAIQLASRQRLVLDVHPSNFAHLRGKTYYLDDDISVDDRLSSIGYSLLSRVDEYASFPGAVEQYVERLERDIAQRLTAQDVERLGLGAALDETLVRTETGGEAKRRILLALDDLKSEAGP